MADSTEFQPGVSPQAGTEIPDKDTTARFAQFDHLRAEATLKYTMKDYDAAAEFYSQATELQAELNGELASQNADLLYQYGRCLYHVAVAHSDVLGSKVAGEKRQDRPSRSKPKTVTKDGATQTNTTSNDQQRVDEQTISKVVEERDGPIGAEQHPDMESKPFFQFTGDENFDDSGEEKDNADGEGQEGGAEDEEDDFANAYEVLDLARVLLLKNLEEAQAGKGKKTEPSAVVKQLKERLADTHDLQAEISLEGERFPHAVVDLRAALELKEELYPPQSSLIAETHYKLSLALEFSSITQQKGESGEIVDRGEATIDEAMREEAAEEMEAAIASCTLRIQKEEAHLADVATETQASNKSKVTQADIEELAELRQPHVSINDPKATGSIDGANPLSGILGSLLGESDAAQKARLEEVSKGANDLTRLVKRKKGLNAPWPQPVANEPPKTDGKRKVEFDEEVVEVGTGKKARLSDGEEE